MLELAEIIRRHAPGYRARFGTRMPAAHGRALEAIARCRTPANGGHRYACTQCGREHYGWHSCQHRSCPQCGGAEAHAWLERQCAKLLPVPYFMVTFTLPEELREVCRREQRWFYRALFEASAATLKEVAAEPKHLGAELGFLGVLHTWTRQLAYHPHVHYIVPGGGLREDGAKWRKCGRVKNNEPYLLPVRVLSATFRDKLKARVQAERPELSAGLLPQIPAEVWTRDWVVHSQPCSPTHQPPRVPSAASAGSGLGALRYLSAYVFRTALSNRRLLADQDGRVSFGYTESGTGLKKTCQLTAVEFLRRFLQHVLPKGFHKVRSFGWLHPRAVSRFLLVQSLLAVPLWLSPPAAAGAAPPHLRCPHCGQFALVAVAWLKRRPP